MPVPRYCCAPTSDALPVIEDTGLAYASQVKVKASSGSEVGVMHACGHDMHMTCFVGTARYLASHKDAWQGTLVLIGQPAEERGVGAKAMLENGLYERFPKPDFALALHVDTALEAGRVGCRAGYCLANTDGVDITVRGKGGHGAYPHTTIDPIVEAAQLILALQTIVSREVRPTEPSVITVGGIQGGTKHNIIPDSCHLQLTVRSYSPEVRKQLHEAIRRKAKGIALASGALSRRFAFRKALPPSTTTTSWPHAWRRFSASRSATTTLRRLSFRWAVKISVTSAKGACRS